MLECGYFFLFLTESEHFYVMPELDLDDLCTLYLECFFNFKEDLRSTKSVAASEVDSINPEQEGAPLLPATVLSILSLSASPKYLEYFLLKEYQ